MDNKENKKIKKENKQRVRKIKKETGYVPIGVRIIAGFFGLIFMILSFSIFIACFAYNEIAPEINKFYKASYDEVRQSTKETFRQEENSYIYDKDGNCLAKLKADKDSTYLEYDEIPEDVINAFVAVEDRRFYQHNGVDLKSILKAVYLLYENSGEIERGASTITQQLARNIFLSNEVSYERKLREVFCALAIEELYTKEEILEFYINNIYFGNNYYGIGAASLGYFSKPVSELNVSQIAFLCSVPNNPTHYDPITNYDNTLLRRDKILDDMHELGYITEEELEKALNKKIKLKLAKQKFYNYEVSYAIESTVEYLMERNGFKLKYNFETEAEYTQYRTKYLEEYSSMREELFRGGYSVYTTIDKDKQKILQNAIDNNLSFSTKKTDEGTYWLQGASTVIDNETGKVVAIVGGRTQDTEQRTLNRGFQAFNQPGSTFKPLAVYTPALETGYTKDTIVEDKYSEDGPRNSGNNYEGYIKLYRAVVKSKNVVAWNIFKQLGPAKALNYVKKMRFSKIVSTDNTLAASLGGLTYGTSTVEMASGYATLCNDGVYRVADCLSSIVDRDGKEIYLRNDDDNVQVYSAYAARCMTEILQGVIKERYGTGYGLALNNGMPSAAKTGTTNDQTDAWFCGYSPYYTVAVWVGTDRNESIDNLWGATYPGEIWRDVQNVLCYGKEVKDFPDPSEVKEKKKKSSKKSNSLLDDVEKEESEAKYQEQLIKAIDELLVKYDELTINSWSSIEEAESLSNQLSTKINQVSNESLRLSYIAEYNAIKVLKNSAIEMYKARHSTESTTSTTETTTEKEPITEEVKKSEATTETTTAATTESTTATTETTEATTSASTSTETTEETNSVESVIETQ